MSLKSGQIHYQGVSLSLWDSFGLKDFTLRLGGFCEDSRGRDTNAAKNLLARGWALMADLGFCHDGGCFELDRYQRSMQGSTFKAKISKVTMRDQSASL